MKTLILLITLLATIANAETRHALVMGVWDYRDPTFPPLPEPGIQADLNGMEGKLTSLGFTVTVVRNPTLKQAKDAVDAFGRRINDQPGAALFYFTGHGSEYDGKNFLIPAGTAISENGDLDTEALAADRVLARLEKNTRFANIVFLDCCRNSLSKSGGTGMAAMSAKGTFIGYATATTKTSQATSNGSFYTSALVKYLGTPGLSITDMHTKVTREVKLQDSTQNPFQYSGLDDLFFFVPGGTANVSMSRPDSSAELERLRKENEALRSNTSRSSGQGFTNTLGMRFVPVPGTKLLFCVHETRVADYGAYANANSGVNNEWEKLATYGKDQHPVANVNWEEATAFCRWLSAKEGRIYRLPTDHEWSIAVGIGSRENASTIPAQKDGRIIDAFPWGGDYPPGPKDGNYDVSGVPDGYKNTAPVMQFKPTALGLYDLGGNVWEWCEDWYDANHQYRVVRGGSWDDRTIVGLRSSCRVGAIPLFRITNYGFRCVLVGG